MGSDIWMNLTKSGLLNRLNRLFTESELADMLEASGYDAVNIVPWFIGAIVDKRCSLEKTACKTEIFTTNVDVVKLLYWNYINLEWSEKEPNFF